MEAVSSRADSERHLWGGVGGEGGDAHRHRDHVNTLAQDPISEISRKGLGSDLVDGRAAIT